MKLITLFILLFTISCSSQRTNNYDVMKTYVKKIDSTSWNYILHLENKKNKIVVPVFKECNSRKDYLGKIEVGKKYNFVLVKEIVYGKTEREFMSQHIDGKEIWNSDMKGVLYYVDCVNMCGLYINRK